MDKSTTDVSTPPVSNTRETNLVTKVVVWCGALAVFTSCFCAISYFATLSIHVWRNGSWPSYATAGIMVCVLVGPVLTSWQFMGVRKFITQVISKDDGVGGILKDVVAQRYGYQRGTTQPQKQNDES